MPRKFKHVWIILLLSTSLWAREPDRNHHHDKPTPSPTATPTPSATPTPNPTASPSPTPTPTGQWKPGLSFRSGIPTRPISATVTTANGIQSALNSAPVGTAVHIPAGTYNIGSATLSIPAGVTLEGDGNTTIIHQSGGAVITMGVGQAWGSRINVTGGSTAGSTQITVASASGILAGNLIVISQLNPSYVATGGDDGQLTWAGAPGADGSGNDTTRDMEQVDKVVSVSGNTLTLERPLYISYTSSPVINVMAPAFEPGIENFQIQPSGGSANGPNTITIDGCDEPFAVGIYTNLGANSSANYAHYYVADSYAGEIRECTLQGGGANTSGADYGTYLVNNSSDFLVEDNVFIQLRHPVPLAAGTSGDVIGYNFTSGSFQSAGAGGNPNSTSLDDDLANHGAESFFNLFEGNVGACWVLDNTWGGNAFFVAHRNWLKGWSVTDNNTAPCVTFDATTYSPSLLNNVLGRPGESDTDINVSSNFGSTETETDNWSFNSNSQISPNGTLQNSLYYSAKPSWWGTAVPWPANGRDCSPVDGGNPATARRPDLQ